LDTFQLSSLHHHKISGEHVSDKYGGVMLRNLSDIEENVRIPRE
jgi:hypothetical protein